MVILCSDFFSVNRFLMKYITANELYTLLQTNNRSTSPVIVIDVRDEDIEGGQIKSAINIPCSDFLDNVERYAEKYKEADLVVFHCALSQVRGPKCYNAYSRYTCNGAILRGGFETWRELFGRSDYTVHLC